MLDVLAETKVQADTWLKELTTQEGRQRAADVLYGWAVKESNKELDGWNEWNAEIRKRITVLTDEFGLAYSGGRVVVTANGDAAATLKGFRRGSDRLPAADVDKMIVDAVLA